MGGGQKRSYHSMGNKRPENLKPHEFTRHSVEVDRESLKDALGSMRIERVPNQTSAF